MPILSLSKFVYPAFTENAFGNGGYKEAMPGIALNDKYRYTVSEFSSCSLTSFICLLTQGHLLVELVSPLVSRPPYYNFLLIIHFTYATSCTTRCQSNHCELLSHSYFTPLHWVRGRDREKGAASSRGAIVNLC